jgi:hypothetical protein
MQQLVVKDPARHVQAVAACDRAATCAYFKTYAADLARRQVDAMPARSLQDLSLRVRVQPNGVGGWSMARSLWSGASDAAVQPASEALLAAGAGKPDAEVNRLLEQTRVLARLMAADAEDVRELQFAYGAYQTASEMQAHVRVLRGDNKGAREEMARCDALARKVSTAATSVTFDYERMGILTRTADWSRQGTLDTTAIRRAEYATADQVGVGALAAALLALAVLYGLLALARWLLVRRAALAPRLFVGWRRCTFVVAVGAVLPLVLYFAYARLTPLGGRAFGLNMTWMRVEIEYAVLGGVVILLTSVLAGRAVAARLRELHVEPPTSLTLKNITSGWPRPALIALGLAGLCLVLALFMPLLDREVLRRFAMNFGGGEVWLVRALEVAAAVALAMFAVGIRVGARSRSKSVAPVGGEVAYGWYARAAFAPLLMAAIAVALVGLPLRVVERRAVRAAAESGQPAVYLGSLGRSVLEPLRDQLVRGDVNVTADEIRRDVKRYVADNFTDFLAR